MSSRGRGILKRGMLLMLYTLILFVLLRHGVVRPIGEDPEYVMMKMWGLGDEEKNFCWMGRGVR